MAPVENKQGRHAAMIDGFSILLVDDNPAICRSLKDVLEARGARVHAASSGRIAIDRANTNYYDLAIVDIQLTDISGVSLVEKLAAINDKLDFIYITGHASLATAVGAVRQKRIISYETKPIDIDRLFTIIDQVCQRRKSERDLEQVYRDLEDKIALRTRELQRAVVEKENAKRSLQTIFHFIPDGVFSFGLDMKLQEKNSFAATPFCFVDGKIPDPGFSPAQGECCRALEHTMVAREPVRELLVESDDSDTEREYFIVNTIPLLDKDGNFQGVLLTIRDITRLAVLEEKLLGSSGFRRIVGKSREMRLIFDLLRNLAKVETTVLIAGESGTGKELIVDTLHEIGPRASGPLIKVNCSALPETLLESELFGHVRGAFTGATSDRVGRIEAAEGGVLFLDELGEMTPRVQVKLLRFLDDRRFERLGESNSRQADVQVYAATNADITRMVEEGVLRKDLYYRLKVMVITLPPLRQRVEDIPLLSSHFITLYASTYKKNITGLSAGVMKLFLRYKWPGNVRELKHVIEHASIICPGGVIKPSHLPAELHDHALVKPQQQAVVVAVEPEAGSEKAKILTALGQTGWNVARAARLLGISRATLYVRFKEFNISRS